MKSKDFLIRGEYFPTKVALQKRIRKVRDSYPDYKALSSDDFEFMLEVLSGHPSYETKYGAGVESMYVRTNPVYKNNRGFWLRRVDGTETDFSFVECLTPTPQIKKFALALRVAIEPYTMTFKSDFFANQTGPYFCPYTGEPLEFIGSHVDHKAPHTFQKLVQDFIKTYAIDLETVEIAGDYEDNVYQNTLVDEELNRLWIEFHNDRAELQIVSQRANLSHLKKG